MYLPPNFQFNNREELTIGFLEQMGAGIVGYEERELIGTTDRNLDKTKSEKLDFRKFTKELPLCKGPDNKYWILGADGELKLEYIK